MGIFFSSFWWGFLWVFLVWCGLVCFFFFGCYFVLIFFSCQGSHGIKSRFTAFIIVPRYARVRYRSFQCWKSHALSSMHLLFIIVNFKFPFINVYLNRTEVYKEMVYFNPCLFLAQTEVSPAWKSPV